MRALIPALTSSACKISWHGNVDSKVLGLGLRETIDTRNVVGDGQVLGNNTGVSSGVNITDVWTSSIGVDLMDGDGHNGTGLY